MSAPGVIVSEVNQTTTVPQGSGVYTAVVIPALKGPVNQPILISNQTEFLSIFTPDNTIGVGFDLSHFSALADLEQNDLLWVVRAAHNPLYAGMTARDSSADASADYAWAIGKADPSAGYSFLTDDLVAIFASSAGAWGDSVTVDIKTVGITIPTGPAFLLNVYWKGTLKEQWTCTTKPGDKDGYGQDCFIDDVLQASAYVNSLTNPMNYGHLPTAATGLVLAGGSDGATVTDSDMIAALDILENKNSYPLVVIMDGGWTTTAYQDEINAVCLSRGDCVGILSTPYALEVETSYQSALTTFINVTLNMNSSYCALYSPHLQIYDKFNGRNIFVDPSGYVAAQISYTAKNFGIWYPAAGFTRGLLNVADCSRRYSDADISLFYGMGINCIKFAPGRGIVIWGEDTLSTPPSDLSKLPTRMMLITIEPSISYALEGFEFDFNDAPTRLQVKTMIDSYMNGILAGGGVADFYSVCDTTNNLPTDIQNYILNVWLFVKPQHAIEYIKFKVILTAVGTSFSVAVTQVSA